MNLSDWFDPTLFGAVFVTLFVIMDPLGIADSVRGFIAEM